ncbi:MAG: hypothetical protein U0984_12385 [Prosthecobacter sp.]|nr:hypothetical protein [Prosthecobacter sp.]
MRDRQPITATHVARFRGCFCADRSAYQRHTLARLHQQDGGKENECTKVHGATVRNTLTDYYSINSRLCNAGYSAPQGNATDGLVRDEQFFYFCWRGGGPGGV